MLLSEFISHAVNEVLSPLYPVAEAKSLVTMLCEEIIGAKNYTPIIEPKYEVPADKLPKLEDALARLAKWEPIQYVLGHADFAGLRFKVTQDVLIPRPETEMLCRIAVEEASRMTRMRRSFGKNAKPVRVLDLCTGSGCIAWKVALSVPGCAVVGVDISEAAIEVAKSQGFETELKESGAVAPKFVVADVTEDIVDLPYMAYDIILSNPPYILESEKTCMRRNVTDYEPGLALFVSDSDPLVMYRGVAHWSEMLMNEQGMGLTEINESLGPQTKDVFKEEGFNSVEIVKDLFEKNRFVLYKK